MTKRNQKDERFDAAAYQAGKLAWIRKTVRDARRVATRFGMEQSELDALGRHLATGEEPDLRAIADETFEEARDRAEAELRTRGKKDGKP